MKPYLLLLFLLVSCTAKQEKETSVLFADDADKADTLQYYDLHEIQHSGTIIAGTLSGPDTYYEYHGKGMGAQYMLAEAFAQSIGVVLQMEISPDTASLLQKLKQGQIDFIALEMPNWQTRDNEPLLSQAIAEWWKPERIKQIESTACNTTVTVRRHMRPVMQDAAHGIISAYDDLPPTVSSPHTTTSFAVTARLPAGTGGCLLPCVIRNQASTPMPSRRWGQWDSCS